VLLCVTANHRNTPFDLLERLSVDAEQLSAQVAAGHDSVRGAVGIATCNRVEVYLDIDAPDLLAREIAARTVGDALDSLAGTGTAHALSSAELLNDARAIHHLFSVSAGLESVAVGEEEIAGQIKRAALAARQRGTTSPALDRAFQHAIRTARAARAEGDPSKTGRSLVRLALDLVGSRLHDWEGVNVLLIGTGQYAATTVAALRDRSADRIRVYSPTGRAQVFATRSGTEPTNELTESLVWADVVITCTTRLSVGLDDLPTDARFLAVDLGLPRNIDPAVGAADGVTLVDLDMIRLHAPLLHWSAAEDARAVVDAAAHEYTTHSHVDPAIVAMREHILGLVEDEITRARRRGDADGRIEESLRHLAGVLLHTPSTRARHHAARGEADAVADAVATLFGIDVAAEAMSGPHAFEQGEDGETVGLGG
jgi:glutamyl-tRNA reductase